MPKNTDVFRDGRTSLHLFLLYIVEERTMEKKDVNVGKDLANIYSS